MKPITIVERGRGPQLSTSRITVQDLVPYFRASCSEAEIRRWIPALTDEEIAAVLQYYHEHQRELDEQDDRIEEHRAREVELQQRQRPLGGDGEDRFSRVRQLFAQRRQEQNGEGHSG